MVKNVKINIKGKARSKRMSRKRALSKVEKREVTKIAKRVFKSNVEHKYTVQSVEELVPRVSSVYALNPMASITLGTDSKSRIGEVLNNLRLRVKLSYVHLGKKIGLPDLRFWPRSQLRILVIKTKRQLTSGNSYFTDITSTVGTSTSATSRDNCMFYQPTNWGYPYHVAIQDIRKDNDYKVLYDRVITSDLTHGYTDIGTDGFIPNAKFVSAKFSIKLGKFEYEEASTAYARKGLENVYIMVAPYIPKTLAGTDIAGDMVMHYSLTYTDA